jgi:hypothetical protein
MKDVCIDRLTVWIENLKGGYNSRFKKCGGLGCTKKGLKRGIGDEVVATGCDKKNSKSTNLE